MPAASEPLTVLRDELDFFNSKLEEWLRVYEGQFALVKNRELIGTFTTQAEAYSAGVKHFGNVPFLIKQVSRVETIEKLPALTIGLIHAHS